MKKTTIVRSIAAAVILMGAFVSTSLAEDAKRKATVEDTTGVVSQVPDLGFDGSESLRLFANSYRYIAVSGRPFSIAIPLDVLIAVEAKGDGYAVSYLWRDKEVTITGKLFNGDITGKTDFGDIKLNISQLKSIKFDQRPKTEARKNKVSNRATLTLSDGTKFAVDTLKRLANYYPASAKYLGDPTQYDHSTDFPFYRGESRVAPDFSTIKRIDFTGDGKVAVALTNGNKATGTISSAGADGITGFTGTYEKGEFFVVQSDVKAIDFGDTKEPQTVSSPVTMPSTKAKIATSRETNQEQRNALLPPLKEELQGSNPVRVRNPNDFAVACGLILALQSSAASSASTDEVQKGTFVVDGTLVDKSGTPVTNQTVYVFPFYKTYLRMQYEQGRLANPRGTTDVKGKFQITVPLDFVKLGENFTLGTQEFVGLKMQTRSLTRNGVQLVLSLSKDDTLRKVPVGDIVVERE